MLVNHIFTKQDTLVEKSLDALALRMQAASNNVANVNTPGYTRQVVSFEDALAEAYDASPKYEADVAAGETPSALQAYMPQLQPEKKVQRLDGNAVSPETEMSEMVQAAIAYNALTRRAGWSTLKQIIQNSR